MVCGVDEVSMRSTHGAMEGVGGGEGRRAPVTSWVGSGRSHVSSTSLQCLCRVRCPCSASGYTLQRSQLPFGGGRHVTSVRNA